MDFNEAINKTKEVFGVAKGKTVEAVNIGKMKYDLAAAQKELEKLYARLGNEAFDKLAEIEVSPAVKVTIDSIKEKKEQIKKAKEELLKAQAKRICPKCGAAIDENAVFCSICGERLVFTEE